MISEEFRERAFDYLAIDLRMDRWLLLDPEPRAEDTIWRFLERQGGWDDALMPSESNGPADVDENDGEAIIGWRW